MFYGKGRVCSGIEQISPDFITDSLMAARRVIPRPLDRDFFNRYRRQIALPWLHEDWNQFRLTLRQELPPAPVLTEIDQDQILRAGQALRRASKLLVEESGSAPREAAVRLLLEGTVLLLGHWAPRLPKGGSSECLLSRLRHYLVEELAEFRNALERSGESAQARVQFDAESGRVVYEGDGRSGRLSFADAVMTGFLWWIFVTEWSWDNISMK